MKRSAAEASLAEATEATAAHGHLAQVGRGGTNAGSLECAGDRSGVTGADGSGQGADATTRVVGLLPYRVVVVIVATAHEHKR